MLFRLYQLGRREVFSQDAVPDRLQCRTRGCCVLDESHSNAAGRQERAYSNSRWINVASPMFWRILLLDVFKLLT